jgi:GxxExxY protein
VGFVPISGEVERIAAQVVDAALAVHRALGPGLLESAYEACLAHELTLRQVPFRTQVSTPVKYNEVSVATGLRIDILVGESVIVELKAVEKDASTVRSADSYLP